MKYRNIILTYYSNNRTQINNMKYFKTFLVLSIVCILINCRAKVETTSNFIPEFKMGKSGFKEVLKKQIDFEELAIATYYTKKDNKAKEQGLNLTFKNSTKEVVYDNLVQKDLDFITEQVKQNLLNLDHFDYVNIIFEKENKKGNVKRTYRTTIKEEL